MKKIIIGLVLLGLVGIGIFYGCASTTSTTPTPSPSPSPTPATGSISITGSLAEGNIRTSALRLSSGIKVQATVTGDSLENYEVVAVGKSSGSVYYPDSKTDASGNFNISNLPSGESFYLDILDTNNKLVAPVAMGASSDGKIIMAVTPEAAATIEVGQIAFEASKGMAAPVTEPASFEDKSADALATPKTSGSLVTKGSGTNLGKGEEAKMASGTIYDSTTVDGDKDGLPNVFDADNNGDTILDEIDGQYALETLTGASTNIDRTYVFTNFKVPFERTDKFTTDYQELSIAIGVVPKSTATVSISSVTVEAGPAWITKATVSGGGSDQGKSWKDVGYKLYSQTLPAPGESSTIYEVQLNGVKPGEDVNAGDTFTIVVNYSNGTVEKATKMLNFVFKDIPRVTHYYFGPSGTWKPAPTNYVSRFLTTEAITTTEVHLRWTRPKDENNEEIKYAKYTFEYSPTKTGQAAREVTVIPTDEGLTSDLLAGYCFSGLLSPEATEIMIAICARSAANDNAAHNLYFYKTKNAN